MKEYLDQLMIEALDKASIIWLNREQEPASEVTWAIAVFRCYEAWDDEKEQPDWHSVKREAQFVNQRLGEYKDSD